MERVDCIVIGAGVVGLAVAREMAQRGLETVVLERALDIGTGTSSRNSEVIHAGIYYPTGSLKAELCVRGKALLYDYCAARNIPHQRCGKFIVATSPDQQQKLEQLLETGRRNGVDDLVMMSGAQAMAAEASLRCVAALDSRSTGIIDSHGLMLALRGDFEAAGGMVAFDAPVTAGVCGSDGVALQVAGSEPMEIQAPLVINAAGLGAQGVARCLRGMPETLVPPLFLAKGNYYSLQGRSPFSRLIYPVPEDGGLGVHLTLDLGGQARFGPDVEWVDTEHYQVDARRADVFYGAIRRYWPALADGALQPAYAGIRPKISGPGSAAEDFMLQGPSQHGQVGLMNLFGIESPGLTASMAIGQAVADQML
ncbi:NAD(P)/FAD-dependent oxidoreductase [Roseateles sp. SL47]|uniref:NAD(P)/FAD-dependent oxidoreductase n=1 Tax=Roseateles sp. SL47 TaxID=2995138 RepID=UPI00226D73FF|nr:NAD(P)/FAD-dependent oxidoreductase [Roseateles sp. SL47]WAC71380.1 NAD(P)/FAD-dependent oxidoreductase [Roseateles sp. SL47]